MGNIYSLLGILSVVFALLAAMNALKKYSKNQFVLWIAKKHKIFGMIAIVFALSHMILAVFDQAFRVTGLLTLSLIILTGLFGILFYRMKHKKLYIAHRILAILSIVMICVHIILNYRY
jgi:hypothetical protein